ncbi:MAG: shikimate dehydrogenase [Bacteroidales bacterium]|nr:shikimate dehydrogenase [Bacteroidales bacterium]
MQRYGLIGRRLGHSWSQQWFEALFSRLGLDDHAYGLYEMEHLDGLRQWVEREHIAGFNVTIPYKQAILPLLDGLAPEAEAIGAVNCVVVSHGRLIGHNTDAPAFLHTLQLSSFAPRHVLILGTGGAAQAVTWAAKQMGTDPLFVSRNPKGDRQIAYPDLARLPLAEATLLVNATPVGMHPDAGRSPLDLARLPLALRVPQSLLVYDLIYNPSPTLLLRQAAALGARTHDGLAMLHRQARLSWALWNHAASCQATEP